MIVPLGAVLCGGVSRRMGSDKALVVVDGVAMAQRMASVLADAGCHPVVAIGGDRDALTAMGLDCVDDEFPGEGPLGGILTALAHGAPAMVVACDLPRLAMPTVRAVIMALGEHEVAVARTDRAEPLCAAWSRAAGNALRTRFGAGERAVHRAIEGLDVAWVTVPATDLRNVNTPGDLRSL